MPDLPHLQLPATITASGRLATCEQGSEREVAQAVRLIIATEPGSLTHTPDLGVPADELHGGTDPDALADRIVAQEPRADGVLVIDTPDDPGSGIDRLIVTVDMTDA